MDVIVGEIVLLLGELDELAHLLLDLRGVDAALALGLLLGGGLLSSRESLLFFLAVLGVCLLGDLLGDLGESWDFF